MTMHIGLGVIINLWSLLISKVSYCIIDMIRDMRSECRTVLCLWEWWQSEQWNTDRGMGSDGIGRSSADMSETAT